MPIYQLPENQFQKLQSPKNNPFKFMKDRVFWVLAVVVITSSIFGYVVGGFVNGFTTTALQLKDYLPWLNLNLPVNIFPTPTATPFPAYVPQTSQEEAVINAVKNVSPAVVSIIISKDVPIIEQYYVNPFEGIDPFGGDPFGIQIPQYQQQGTQKQEVGGGTGFIISQDGIVLTNKHVVMDNQAEYTVFTNDGKKFPAKVLALDPVQDLAVIRIDRGSYTDPFPTVKLGDSSILQIGQSVITIGNALGEYRNTVSVGVVSGLGRTISASGGGLVETLDDVIQTDAAINKGNSGGPLLNLKGEVIGINTAMAESAQSIGFAIPINNAKKDIESVLTKGKISYPFLGVRYVLVTAALKAEKKLSVDYGALISTGDNGEAAVTPGSVAEKAGLKLGDIILEINNEKITADNSLAKIIVKYNAGDKVTLKVLSNGQEKTVSVKLGERSE